MNTSIRVCVYDISNQASMHVTI